MHQFGKPSSESGGWWCFFFFIWHRAQHSCQNTLCCSKCSNIGWQGIEPETINRLCRQILTYIESSWTFVNILLGYEYILALNLFKLLFCREIDNWPWILDLNRNLCQWGGVIVNKGGLGDLRMNVQSLCE